MPRSAVPPDPGPGRLTRAVGLSVRSLVRRALDSGGQRRVRREREPVGCFYPEASFAIPGHVYGPDGTRVSLPSGITSIGKVDPATSLRWRARYGNTLVKGVDEEPLEIVS
jgi:hypothetical protein